MKKEVVYLLEARLKAPAIIKTVSYETIERWRKKYSRLKQLTSANRGSPRKQCSNLQRYVRALNKTGKFNSLRMGFRYHNVSNPSLND